LEDGKKVTRPVKVVKKTESTVIIAEGLQEGDRVVIP
jgi:hypothetical protein